ncbi:MAG: DMT family transporter [Vibrio sp.]
MPYMMLTLAAMFWGGNYVIGHILVSEADPILMTESRWLITAILLSVLYSSHIKSDYLKIKKSFFSILLLSIFGQVLFPLTLYIGLQTTTSLNAAIYMSATPCMVLIINRFIFKDTVSRNNIIGVFLSTLGVIYLILKGNIKNSDFLNTINVGDVWAMGSAMSWAFYCSFLRIKDKTISSNAFVTTSSVLGAVILSPIVWYYCTTQQQINLESYTQGPFWLGLMYLVVFPSWLSYVFWNKGIGEIGATRGEIYTHIIPLSGGVFSVLFLGVRMEPFHLVSAILIALGIWFCSKKEKANVTPIPPSA